MFLIVGAAGTLGRATAHQLLAAGHSVRALVRDPSKVPDLQSVGAEVISGNIIDRSSLERACRGVEAVLVAVHGMLGRGANRSEQVDDAGHRMLIDIAREAGVKHFVYASIMGAAPDHPVDLWRTKYRVEHYLKASGLSYTILRPAASMEHHAHEFLGKQILQRGRVTILGRGRNPTNFVASRDVARYAVLALTDKRLQDKTIEVGGPDNLSKNQVAELYGKLSGRTPIVRHIPPAVLRVMSMATKPLHPGISRILLVSAVSDTTDQAWQPSDGGYELGMTPTSLESFIRERVAEAGLAREPASDGAPRSIA